MLCRNSIDSYHDDDCVGIKRLTLDNGAEEEVEEGNVVRCLKSTTTNGKAGDGIKSIGPQMSTMPSIGRGRGRENYSTSIRNEFNEETGDPEESFLFL